MSFRNVVRDQDGNVLTVQRWRKQYPFFREMPFYSDIMIQDEIGTRLKEALLGVGREGFFEELLLVR